MMVGMALLAGMLAAAPAQAAEKFTERELGALFYYDVGPEEVDVSRYPEEQQRNYGVFARTCSQCHTLARPINSPISTRKAWKRYVRRMHVKTGSAPLKRFSRKDARTIIDFLAYDSKVRKVDAREAFEGQAVRLMGRFAAAKKERSRRQIERDKKKVKRDGMPEGVAPQP